jgi:hypothetical protein
MTPGRAARVRRPASSRLPLTALAILFVITVAGCTASGGPSRNDDRDARNKAESDAVVRALRQLPGVVRVDGGYSRDASNPGGAVVLSITVRPGTDLQHVADETVRLVWLSRLDPITSMTVTVGPEGDPGAAIDRHADFKFERDQLTAMYGPRPASS